MPGPRTAKTGDDQDDAPDEYQHLESVLAEFAALPRDDPRHSPLRDRLAEAYLPIAEHIARRYSHRGESYEDLRQVACVGLLNAIDRFEPEKGYRFLAFAVPTVTGEVRRYFRDSAWSMRVPRRLKELHVSINGVTAELSQQLGRAPRPSEIAARLRMPVAEVLEGLEASQAYRPDSLDGMPNAHDDNTATVGDLFGYTDRNFELVTQAHSLAPALAALPPRERSILVMRFYDEMTQSQIAERIGTSQMQVSRLLSQTLARLRTEVDREPEDGDADEPVSRPRVGPPEVPPAMAPTAVA